MNADSEPRTHKQLTHLLIDELARNFWDIDLARLLYISATFPLQHIPDFKTPHEFWTLVVQAASTDERFPGGGPALIAAAAKQRPANPIFSNQQQFSKLRPRNVRSDLPLDDEILRSSCAELFLDPRRSTRGTAQAIAPTILLTCAHLVKDAEIVWLRPWDGTTRLEARVLPGGLDVDLDVAVLECPQWPGRVAPVSSDLPAVGAPIKAFILEEDEGPDGSPTSSISYHGMYFGLGDDRKQEPRLVAVHGPAFQERHAGALLFDTETGLAWGLASPTGSRRTRARVGRELNVATTIAAILTRFSSLLANVESWEPPGLARHRTLAKAGWTLLWRAGARDTNRRANQHLPFFVKGEDHPSPDDIARGEAYPRRAAETIAKFLSADATESPRWAVIRGKMDDGRRTLALLAARLLHERGTQVLSLQRDREPVIDSCIDLIDSAPVLFMIESRHVGMDWYQNLTDHLNKAHEITGRADVMLIGPEFRGREPELEYAFDGLRRGTRLLEIDAAPTLDEIDPVGLWQHVKRTYALRAFPCERELEDPREALRDVGVSQGLLKRALMRLAEHAGVPPNPRRHQPSWLTSALMPRIAFTSALGLTLPWPIARSLAPAIPLDPGEGEWGSIDWNEAGLRRSHGEQSTRPEGTNAAEFAEQLLALAVRTGDVEFAGAASLILLQDPELHGSTQEIIAKRLAGLSGPPSPAEARMLWSAYLLCSDEELRRAIVRISFETPTNVAREVRHILAKIVFTNAWKAFREATTRAPGSRFDLAQRASFLAAYRRIQALATDASSQDIENLSINTGAILHVVDRCFGENGAREHPASSTAREPDEYWSMILRAFEHLVDEPMVTDHLVLVVEESSLPDRGPGVHERLARVLLRLHGTRSDELERRRTLQLMAFCATPGPRGAEVRSSLAHALYIDHLDAARKRRPRLAAEWLEMLRNLYDAEPERRSLRFHYLGALINAHRAAIHRGDLRDADRLILRALNLVPSEDLPEVRSRLSVAIYNAHRSATTAGEPDAADWLRRLRGLAEQEDATPRSRQLLRQAYENTLILMRPTPVDSSAMGSLLDAYRSSLPPEERHQASQKLANIHVLHDWAALSDANWEDLDSGVNAIDAEGKRQSLDPLQTTLFDDRLRIIAKPLIDARTADKTAASRVTHTVIHQVSGSTAARQARKACLIVICGSDLGHKHDIKGRRMTVGRSAASDIRVMQDAVSRSHAIIIADDSGVRLVDNEATNGIYINNRRVREAFLRDGDIVRIGRTLLKFRTAYDLESTYQEELARLTNIDGLTQLYNKRHFIHSLKIELLRTHHREQPLALIMLDIDHFKRCNETFGHTASDFVLQQLAQLIHDHGFLRRYRKSYTLSYEVARYGSGQLAIFLSKLDIRGATELAEAIRTRVEQTQFVFEDSRIGITISVGVAELEPRIATASDLIDIAHERLHRAKRLGRNRVVHTDLDD